MIPASEQDSFLDDVIKDIGQLFVFGFAGKELDDDALYLLKEKNACGVILFARNIESLEQVVALNASVVNACTEEYPALISVDQEGGRVARLRGICTDVVSMRSLGKHAIDDNDLPYRVGAMMARELAALGFHMDFAPVVDVDTNPKNPVIGERSFSRDANEVCVFSAQFIRGMQQAGIAASAKHFPGHGDTDTDSHTCLPTLPHDLARLEDVELRPFQSAIAAGVATIMTAHVLFPALDAEHPATLSEKVLHALLRQKLGYQGVIISDDLEMAGVAEHYEVEEMVVKGLEAGVDLFLICHTPGKVRRAIAAVEKALRDEVLSPARVAESLSRIRALKERFVGAPAAPTLEEATAIVRCGPHQKLIQEIQEQDSDQKRPSSFVDDA
ncbi:MAG: beta-N-acetylhexosaminidase [Deltaproteobacteria bacterium]|nr:beta-N-acetylhexosaminidase [Deltaproteobacteria bacterium]